MKKYTDKTRFVPGPDPVQHIEISDEHKKLKTVIFVIAAAIAVFAFARFVIGFLNRDPGWTVIEVRHGSEAESYAKEYVLNYYVAESGSAYKAEVVALETAYTESLEEAKKVYDLGLLNGSPNENVKVSDELYSALKKLDDAGDRKVFLAPLYSVYRQIFYSQSDDEAMKYDPFFSEEVSQKADELKTFIIGPEHIRFEFGDDAAVTLCISEEYLEFAKENNIEKYADLYWMENALIVDYVSDAIINAGYRAGKFASYDGYSRSFSDSEGYAQVIWRNYPDRSLDMDHFYVYLDGTIRHGYLDDRTGLPLEIPDEYGEKRPGNLSSCFDIVIDLMEALK